MRAFLLLLIVSLGGACGPAASKSPAGSEISLSLADSTHAAGDTIRLTLHNRSTTAIGYNLCSSTLEQHGGQAWARVPESRMCTMELRSLQPSDSATQALALDADLAAGEYRYRTTVTAPLGGTRRELTTQPFRVQ